MIMIIIVNLQYKNNVVASILFGTHGLQEHSGWDYSLFDGSFPHLFSSVVLAMSNLWGKTVSHHGKLSQFLTPILITTAADLLLPPPFDPPRPAQGSTARLKKQNNTKGKNKKRLKKQTEKIPDLSPVQLTVSSSSQSNVDSVILFAQWLEPSNQYAWQYRGVHSGVGTSHVSLHFPLTLIQWLSVTNLYIYAVIYTCKISDKHSL